MPLNLDDNVISAFARQYASDRRLIAYTGRSDAQALASLVSDLRDESASVCAAGPCAVYIYELIASYAIRALVDTPDQSVMIELHALITKDLDALSGYLARVEDKNAQFTHAELGVIRSSCVNLRAYLLRLEHMRAGMS